MPGKGWTTKCIEDIAANVCVHTQQISEETLQYRLKITVIAQTKEHHRLFTSNHHIFSWFLFNLFSFSNTCESVHDEKRKKIINMASALVSYHVGMTDLWLRSLLADRGLSVPLVPWQWPSCLTMASSGMLLSPAPPFSCTLVNIFRLNVLKRRKKW